ncbi:MAG: hypothetical protein ACRENA_06435 [Vulcanimicrobiaceae bacterium]
MTIGRPTVGIRDTSLTEGQLCVWQGRMTNDMLLPILPRMDRAGFASIELLDPAAFESCLQLTGEDPWERVRLAAKRLTSTPVAVSLAGSYLFGDSLASLDELRRAVQTLARSGIALVQMYDPVNELQRLDAPATLARDAGLSVAGGIVFTLGPEYDDRYFVERARKLAMQGCDAVALLDFAGILHPERVRDLVPALRAALGSTPLEIRTHCRSGRAEISCFAALENGATTLHCACDVLAGGDSVPSSDYFMEHLEREGYQSALDADDLAAVSDYFGGIADARNFPAPVQRLYDPQVDREQFPVELEWKRNQQPAMPSVDRDAWDIVAETPLQQLVAELQRRPWVERLRITKGDFVLETAGS